MMKNLESLAGLYIYIYISSLVNKIIKYKDNKMLVSIFDTS